MLAIHHPSSRHPDGRRDAKELDAADRWNWSLFITLSAGTRRLECGEYNACMLATLFFPFLAAVVGWNCLEGPYQSTRFRAFSRTCVASPGCPGRFHLHDRDRES